jgi:pimeloyl-ACP methyl ester carboxylesterase
MTKKKFLSLLIIIAILISFPIYSNLSGITKNWTLREFQNQELKWQNCYGNFECSTLLVPVDYNKITTDIFHLKVIRFKATDQRQKLGALIVNPGGPGASAFDYAYNAENIVSAAIREKYDIVGFDQRGVGQSDPIRCLTDKETDEMLAGPMIADTPENQRKIVENAKFFASKCKKAAGYELAHLSTFESAKDMDLLRLALDEPKLNYLGKSYGTYLGTLYASLYPLKVGKMILDGAINPSISIQEQNLAQAKGFELALNQFLTKNKISKVSVINLFKKLQKQSMTTKSTRKLNDSLAILGVASALYNGVTGWPKLAQALNQALLGDGLLLLKLSDEYSGRSQTGKYLSNENDIGPIISCLDWPSPTENIQKSTNLKKFVDAAPVFGPYLASSELACKYLFLRHEKKATKFDLTGTSRVMIVGTTRDPATPYEWAIVLSKIFSNSFLITFISDGHTGQGKSNPCVDSAVNSYLLDLNGSFIDVTCVFGGN